MAKPPSNLTKLVQTAVNRPGLFKPSDRDDLKIDVMIREVRQAYGRHEYRIIPMAGTGEAWVSVNKVCVVGAK